MRETESPSELPEIVEMHKIIREKENEMTAKLQQIQELKSDVNLIRAELVMNYRVFVKCAYKSSGGDTSFLNNMVDADQMISEEQHDNAVDFLKEDD